MVVSVEKNSRVLAQLFAERPRDIWTEGSLANINAETPRDQHGVDGKLVTPCGRADSLSFVSRIASYDCGHTLSVQDRLFRPKVGSNSPVLPNNQTDPPPQGW